MAAPARSADAPVPLPSKSDRWVEVRTKNFTLYGNASESKTRDVGLEMERLRAVLVLLKRGSAGNAAVPTWVYVFKNHSALVPYLPRDSDPERTSSFYQGSWEGNYAMLSAAWNTDPRPTVYHSYIYDFIQANFTDLPLWYEVGIAGYYSTFQTEGDEARTGMLPEDDLLLLRTRGMWLPLERLLAADYDSPEYRDPDNRSLFYAESWALAHYLMQGNPERAPQLGRFLLLRKQGRPQDEAFREAFGTDYATLYGELVSYIRNNKRFFYNRVKFADLKPPTEARTTPMSYEDVVVRLGDLLAHTKRLEEGERYYDAALAANPGCAGALAGLAWVRQRQERKDEAAALVRKAAEAGSTDFRVYYADGRARWEALTEKPRHRENLDPEDRAQLEAARAAFRRSAELNPDYAEALAALGRTYRLEPRGANVEEGIAALEAAKKRLPTREDVAIDLAALYEQKGDKARADALLQTSGPKAEAARTEHRAARDFEGRAAEIHRLVDEGKFDEALALLDPLMEEVDGETRAKMEKYREDLRKTAALQRAAADYNAAMALYNERKLDAALAAFQKLAAASPDPDFAAAARQKAAEIARMQAKKPGKP